MGINIELLHLADTHSLCYLYTVQSKSSPDRGYEFSVVTLMDDRQIDFYNSTDGIRTPKQDWLKEMKEIEWEEGTDQLRYDGKQLNNILYKQMKVFRHDESDGHFLQWRIGCEVNSDGSVSVFDAINKYGYDGQTLISYIWALKTWSASVSQAKEMEEEWNSGHGQDAVQRREECVHWLKTYLHYSTASNYLSKPDVYVFVKKSTTESDKLSLTCLATGFYPKDLQLYVRRFHTSLPEHLLTSSGVRPNEDGTYQLRKSVEIQEDQKADFDCHVDHITNSEAIKEDEGCTYCLIGQKKEVIVGVIVGLVVGLVFLVILCCTIFVCRKKCVCVQCKQSCEVVGSSVLGDLVPVFSGVVVFWYQSLVV
ncbi:hypothetical protein NFI96_007942 [Prochilodus magdalenae]|nr:hypothetical protein NFI96_007942 [Prochilodus magdalenae]